MAEASVQLAEGGTEIVLGGPRYVGVLADAHRRLRPRTYFEIGTRRGTSLRLASCASIAIDPRFQLEEGVIDGQPACFLYQSTSDAFFAAHDPAAILGGPVDLAFIDGLHVLEFALRDFIGTERSVHPGSVIVIDDCCPRDMFMARRDPEPEVMQPTKYKGFWTGDVWKLVPILREYRPDLRVRCIDTTPTALVICTNLDPDDRTLAERYDEIVDRWRDVRLEEYGMARLLEDLQMESARDWVDELIALRPEDPEPPALTRTPTQNELLRADVARMRRSWSWRITRPLRVLGRLAGRS